MIKRAFTEHPASVGESYFQHMGMAFGFGAKMVMGGLACLLHAVFPFLFVRTGRACIEELHHSMVAHRDRRSPDAATPAPGPAHGPTQTLPAMKQHRDALRAAE